MFELIIQAVPISQGLLVQGAGPGAAAYRKPQDTGGKGLGTIYTEYNLPEPHLPVGFGEVESAMGPLLGGDQPVANQLLEDLGQKGLGDIQLFGHLLDTELALLAGVDRQEKGRANGILAGFGKHESFLRPKGKRVLLKVLFIFFYATPLSSRFDVSQEAHCAISAILWDKLMEKWAFKGHLMQVIGSDDLRHRRCSDRENTFVKGF
jgi:hypothetical protein